MDRARVGAFCERAFQRFHHPRYVSPDPLEIVLAWPCLADREVVALIASSLALGRVDAIVRTAISVVQRLADGASPATRLVLDRPEDLRAQCSGFRYRFFDEEQLFGLFMGMRTVIAEHGSLEACFAGAASGAVRGVDPAAVTLAGLTGLVDALAAGACGRLDRSILLSRPDRSSACKRLMLFLRWLVRSDQIDPGGWHAVDSDALIYPVDTHVLRVARALGLTRRLQASLPVALEITQAMREIDSTDPVRFDFCLTRPGIHPLLNEQAWLNEHQDSSHGLADFRYI